jgi:hypothetical protein
MIQSLAGARDLSLFDTSRPALDPTQPHIQFVPAVFAGRRSGRGVNLTSSSSSAEVKNAWCYIFNFPYNFMVCNGTISPLFCLYGQ